MQLNPRFEKSGACPTNESLLAFLRAKASLSPDEETRQIVEHLAGCEFCELLLELLRHYPESPALESPPAPPVPKSLLRTFTTKPVNK